MKTKDSRKILVISVILGVSLVAAAVGLIVSGIGKEAAAHGKAGIIAPTVTDAETDLPIEGAAVVIAETGEICITDANGRASGLSAPLTRDTRFDAIHPKTWSECTVIVYHEDYIPACVFGVQITSAPREGPEILLFPIGEAIADAPATYVESPDKQWTRELMERFAPRNGD